MNKLKKLFCFSFLGIVFWMAGIRLDAVVSIKAEHKGKYYPIIDVKGVRPIVEVDGKRRSVSHMKYGINRQGGIPFKDGYFEMKDRLLQSQGLESMDTGDVFNNELYFRAKIRASVDMKNCFIAIEILPDGRRPGILIHEIPNLKADKWTRVAFRAPTAVELGSGTANEFIFTDGQQVFPRHQYARMAARLAIVEAKKRVRPDSPPQVISQFSPGFPEKLIGILEEGTVRIEFTIGKGGRAHTIKVLESTHELLEPLAIEAIEKTQYKAAVKDGENVPTRLRQMIKFTSPEVGESTTMNQ